MDFSDINEIQYFTCKELFDLYVKRYIQEIGDPKNVLEIGTHVSLNGIIDNYIKKKHLECKPPTCREIFLILKSPPFFFRWYTSDTLCLGSLMVLTYWNEISNTNFEIISAKEVTSIAKVIINKCSGMESASSNNFFSRFYRDIELELENRKMIDIPKPADSNYRAFIIKKSSGPLEYPFNVNPNFCYYNFELEFEGEMYLLREEKPIDFIDENGTYQVNKRLLLKITDYVLEHRNGSNVLVNIS
ncbi:hypothetical protein [Flavobacterium sp.]|uniref:hypothetical protein n=1 Tax=Flavobacterium sp. TaxID=239 RepID=UPI0038CF52D9